MIYQALYMCYASHHQQPFNDDGPNVIQQVNSRSSASKTIRALLRSNKLDSGSWEQYSIHRCHCSSEEKRVTQDQEALDPRRSFEELGIQDGDRFFIKNIDRVEDAVEISQTSRQSTKRKEREEDPAILEASLPLSNTTSNHKLENLSASSATAARTISRLLGGDAWKPQSIGKFGMIQTRDQKPSQSVARLVKTSLQIPQSSKSEAGFFNSDLVEALVRAHHQRISNPKEHGAKRFINSLEFSDYERANELLRGKVNQDGSWERGGLAHLDEQALSNPEERFPLKDSGLDRACLSAARAISVLWNNEKWMAQAPLPGLSPISLRDEKTNGKLREMARLTRVEPDKVAPDGFPAVVLRAFQQAIQQRKAERGRMTSPHGWNQGKDIRRALEILKRDLKEEEEMAQSPSVDNRPSKKMKIESLLNPLPAQRLPTFPNDLQKRKSSLSLFS